MGLCFGDPLTYLLIGINQGVFIHILTNFVVSALGRAFLSGMNFRAFYFKGIRDTVWVHLCRSFG